MLRGMDIAERYIRLAHGLAAHIDGLVDAYFGPPEWAETTKRDPKRLLLEAADLLSALDDVPDAARREWLRAQGAALQTHARLLSGETLPFAEEVRGLYDIAPLGAELAELDVALKAFEDSVGGTGSLLERLEALRAKVTVPDGDVLRVAQPILAELRKRTAEKFGLPDGENFSIQLVKDKPWGGYNWPLGNLQSRIDLNTDFPVRLTALPDLLAHEGYAGHHTEHASKEARLVRENGWQEHQMQLMLTPECVVSEGIAMNALEMLMPREEVETWLSGELAQLAGLDPDDILALLKVSAAQEKIRHVSGTAALMLLGEGRPEKEVQDFLAHYSSSTPERAAQSLRFIRTYRGYIYTYSVGHKLVRDYVAAKGTAGFKALLQEPLTPEQLRRGGM